MPVLPKKSLRVQPKAAPRPSSSVTTTGDDKVSTKGRPKTARDIMLDPHGIYGTRTASRLAVMKRRRNTQRAIIGAALLVAAGVYGVRSLRFGHAALAPLQTIALPGIPATAPITVEDAKGRALLVALQSGSLWCVPAAMDTKITARRVWATGFPASAPPVAQGATVYLPSADGFLRAVNWRRGRGLWGVKMAGTPITTPLLIQLSVAPPPTPDGADDSVPRRDTPHATPQTTTTTAPQLVLEGDDAGTMMACDAATGRIMWQRTLPGPVGNGLRSIAFNKANVARQGVLVPLLSGSGRKGGLVCLEAQSGKTLWRYGLAVTAGASQFTPPEVLEESGQTRVMCADDDGSLIALAADSGKKLWPHKVFLRPQTEAARDDAILPRGAPTAWMGNASATHTLAGRVAIGGNDGWLRAFETNGGRALWTFDAGAPLFQPAVPWLRPAQGGEPARERLLVAPSAPLVWLLDAARGTPEAEFALDAPASGPPLVINDQVFVLTQSGKVLKFGLS